MAFKHLKKTLIFLTIFFALYFYGGALLTRLLRYDPHPEGSLSTCEIVRKRGLRCDEHFVATPQGYILSVHRIQPLFGVLDRRRKPVLVQHGLTGTSMNFVTASEKFSTDPRQGVGPNLGLELARKGYDVWLANNRASHFSMHHLRLNVSDSQYWNYTFDDISRQDIPALIEYVRTQTGFPKISYIGHSQGTMVIFALLANSTQHHYNDIIEPVIALSPVAFLNNAQTSFRYIVAGLKMFGDDNLDRPVFSHPNRFKKFKNFVCNSDARILCKLFFMSICGFSEQVDMSRLGVYIGDHAPSSTSRRNLRHIYQLFHSDKFQRFDYGPQGNLEVYNQESPPEYELGNIRHKSIHLIYTQNDLFAPVEDVKRLHRSIPNVKEAYEVQDPSASHCDPLFGVDSAREVNHKIIQILDSYNVA